MNNKYFLTANEKANCSTVIIGKNVSSTGKVIVGHNEDDEDCIVQLHLVPAMKHNPGETVKFADGKVEIPQVEETLAYYWSEVRCKGGISFADCFVNERGVVVVSNSCRPSKDKYGYPRDNKDYYNLGYGLRTLLGQRARTAREGIEIAAELIEKYGYFSSRCYTIADKDEAWVIQIPKGHQYAARKIADNEVFYIPNHYTLHKIDFTDTGHKNYYWSENVVEYAIENGWYTPAVSGNYDDFDFAKAYQEGPLKKNNLLRGKTAWKMLADLELEGDDVRVFAVETDRIFTPDDVKRILRSHHEGTDWDETEEYTYNPHRLDASSVCGDTTVESYVFEFNEDKNLLRMHRASPKPCITPYAPWYPVAMTRLPAGYEYIGYEAAYTSHFTVDDRELDYDPDKNWWIFRTLQFFTEFDYKNTHQTIKDSIKVMEADWENEKAGIEAAYNTLKDTNPAAAGELLTSYTCAQADKVLEWAKKMIRKLGEEKIEKNRDHWR